MMIVVEDGNGTDTKAAVDSNNRLCVLSTGQIENKFVSDNDGEAYMFITDGFIPITTTGTETGIFYLKNTNRTKKLYVSRIRTCGDQVQKIKLYKNPTGGTLISTATEARATNMNISSANEAECDCYKGADGATLTGGVMVGQHINNVGHANDPFNDALILGPDDSIAITFELDTAGEVCVAIAGYYQ